MVCHKIIVGNTGQVPRRHTYQGVDVDWVAAQWTGQWRTAVHITCVGYLFVAFSDGAQYRIV